MKEDLIMAKKEIKELKEHSLAWELYQDSKKANKRLFVIWIITFVAFILLLTYTIWLLNDISNVEVSTEYTQDVSDIETVNGSIINNNDYGED